MRRLVILGTSTGVGKTWVSSALLKALRARQPETKLLASKPVESGLSPDTLSDAQQLASAAGLDASIVSPDPVFGFREPISPHLAARNAGCSISITKAAEWVRRREATVRDATFSLVETAGGLFTPLNDSETNFELALALAPARWVLVAPDALGVLSELTAHLIACRARGRLPDYVVLSAARPRDLSTGSNGRELRALGITDPIAELGPDDPSQLNRLVDELLKD